MLLLIDVNRRESTNIIHPDQLGKTTNNAESF